MSELVNVTRPLLFFIAPLYLAQLPVEGEKGQMGEFGAELYGFQEVILLL